jgi:hypothetical protein
MTTKSIYMQKNRHSEEAARLTYLPSRSSQERRLGNPEITDHLKMKFGIAQAALTLLVLITILAEHTP